MSLSRMQLAHLNLTAIWCQVSGLGLGGSGDFGSGSLKVLRDADSSAVAGL
jgi:hypothetical protein